MGDQGRWFKLWVTAPSDPHLGNFPLEDFARWCLFGVYMKVHGTNGTVTLDPPMLALQKLFRVDTTAAVIELIKKFPNCTVTPVTNSPVTLSVTWHNWQRYQGDYSGDRVRAWRKKKHNDVTAKEEKRREEKRSPPSPSVTEPAFGHFWDAYPRKVGKEKARQVFTRIIRGRPEDFVAMLLAAIGRQATSEQWLAEHGRFIPHPATWLAQGRWEDELPKSAGEESYGFER